jgi:hypothetical protein
MPKYQIETGHTHEAKENSGERIQEQWRSKAKTKVWTRRPNYLLRRQPQIQEEHITRTSKGDEAQT